MSGAEADRRRLGEWLLPLQQSALEAVTPNRQAWRRILEGSGNDDWAQQVAVALEDASAGEAHRARVAAVAERRLTALDAPWVLEFVQEKLDALGKAAELLGSKPPVRPPLIATTMGGAVNGWAVDPGGASHTLILIPVGLCMFCNLAAKAIARVPPRRDGPDHIGFDLRPDALRASLAADRTPALRFAEMVRAYLLEGRPDAARRWLPATSHVRLHETLLRSMEMFLVAHEYGHVQAGHLDLPPQAPRDPHRCEHEADLAGLAATAQVLAMERTDEVNALVGAHLFLRGADIVARCHALLRGEDPAQACGDTPTHPAAAKRVALLAQLAGNIIGDAKAEGARELCGRYDIILDDFAATAEADMAALRQAGFGPHPVWRPAGRPPQQGAWPAVAL